MKIFDTHDIHGKPYNRTAMLVLLLIATFAAMLNQTSLGTALPILMDKFDIEMATAQQATTWFLLANGVMIPVSAFFATKFSTKWLYFTAYALLLIGLLVTALTPENNWTLFIVGRIIQACSVGITLPLMQIVLVHIFPMNKSGAAMGLNGIVVGLAPAIGPTLSGWILKMDFVVNGVQLSWRGIFIVPFIIVLLAFLLTPFIVHDVIPNRDVNIDFLSLILSIAGFGSFLWGFSNVANKGWTSLPYVIAPIIIGLIILSLFVLRQLKMEKPFLDITVFKNKQFTLTTIGVALSMMSMMGLQMMLPLYLQRVQKLTALDSGLIILPGALLMGILSPISGRIFDRVGIKRMTLIGFLIIAIGTAPMMVINESTSHFFIILVYAVRMFGIGLVMMPLTAGAMSSLDPRQATHGTAANNTIRQVAAAVIVALMSSTTQTIIKENTPSQAVKSANPFHYASRMIAASLKGFHASFTILFGIALAGIILGLFLKVKNDQKRKKEMT